MLIVGRSVLFAQVNPELNQDQCEELVQVLSEAEERIQHITRFPFFKAADEFTKIKVKAPFSIRVISNDLRILILKSKTFKRLEKGGQRKIDHAINLVSQERFAHARMVLNSRYSMADFNREINILRILSDAPFTLKLVDHYEYVGRKAYTSKVAMITRYYKNLDLYMRMHEKTYSRNDILRWSAQIVTSLNYAHSRGIFHNDLKLENILVGDDDDVVVADWGLARYKDDKEKSIDKRNDFLIPPEWITKTDKVGVNRYSEKGDIWALGILVYSLIHKEYPDFIAELIFEEVKVGYLESFFLKLKLYHEKQFSDPLDSLVQRMLSLDPQRRPDGDELLMLIDQEQVKVT